MEINFIIIIVIAIIVLIIAIKFIAKAVIKITAVAAIIAGLLIFLFLRIGHNPNDVNFGEVITQYSISDLEQIYCNNQESKSDSLKCVCIIQPISNDLNSRFSKEELNELEKHRIKFAAELIKSINNKKNIIKTKLKKNNAIGLLKEFKDELTNGKLQFKINKDKNSSI